MESLTDIIDKRLEEVRADICDNYCKYSERYDYEDAMFDEKCLQCPLNRL